MTQPTINHHRCSIRLKGYDYTRPGMYFITLCTWQKACMFGEMVDDAMGLNKHGGIVRDEWLEMREMQDYVNVGELQIMPSHFHGIMVINNLEAEPSRGTARRASALNSTAKYEQFGKQVVCQFQQL